MLTFARKKGSLTLLIQEGGEVVAGRGPTLGQRLKKGREDKGLKHEHVGQLTGFSPSYISHLKAGRRSPGLVLLRKLSQLYGLDFQELVKLKQKEARLRQHQAEVQKAKLVLEFERDEESPPDIVRKITDFVSR